MISWIQNHLIRHGRWIFLSLLALIIVAFVFTIGNTPGCTTDRSAYEQREFYGYDLNSRRDMSVISEKVSLSAYLNGRGIRDEQQFQAEVTSRIALLHFANEIGIPGPSQDELRTYIQTKPIFRGPDGQFSRDAYTRFVDEFEANPRAPSANFIVVLEEDYRIDQLVEALEGPGYLLPSEAKVQSQQTQTTFDLAIATLRFNDFSPEIEPSEEALRDFYSANPNLYEIPERIQASYVFFPAERYTNEVTPAGEAELRSHYISNRARYTAEHEASQPAETPEGEDAPEVTFEDVRHLVEADLSQQAAKRAANEAAQHFAYTLYRERIKRDSAEFIHLMDQLNVTAESIEPFSADQVHRRELPKEILETAFSLGDHRFFSNAYNVNGGFAVLIYEGRIQPVVPPFEEIAAVVESDFKLEEKRRLFNEKGQQLRAELESAIADGGDFLAAAESLGFTTRDPAPFKPAEAPRDLNQSVLRQAQRMQADEISPMLVSNGIGTLIYVQSKEVPEIDADDPHFTQAMDFLSHIGASISSSALVNELIFRGLPEAAE